MLQELQELLGKVPQETGLVRKRLAEVLQRYKCIFAMKSKSLGKTDVAKQTIDTGTKRCIIKALR